MGIKVSTKGNLKRTKRFLSKASSLDIEKVCEKYAIKGVEALTAATPFDTGKTALSWNFKIVHGKTRISIEYYNTNINDGVNIAMILQYGHGTGTGGYVEGIDYINPALRPVFDKIVYDMWIEVTNA